MNESMAQVEIEPIHKYSLSCETFFLLFVVIFISVFAICRVYDAGNEHSGYSAIFKRNGMRFSFT